MQIKISKLWLTELRRNLYHVIGVQRQAKLDIGFLSKKEFIPTNSPCFLLFVHSQLHVYPLQFVNIVYFFVWVHIRHFTSSMMTFIPAICVVVQLHHCSAVALQSGIILTISIHIPHHCSKKIKQKNNTVYNKLFTVYGRINMFSTRICELQDCPLFALV